MGDNKVLVTENGKVSQDRLVGIEILSASKHLDLSLLLPVEIRKEALR